MSFGVPAFPADIPGLRRRILLQPGAHVVHGELEDDFHHFAVTLSHDRVKITNITTSAQRHPWTSCPAAGGLLATRLRGVPLDAVQGFDSPFSHCTHMFDLALLGAVHARDEASLLYSMFVSDPAEQSRVAKLWRNDCVQLCWELTGDYVVSGPDKRQNLRHLRQWLSQLPPDLHEPALVLRRAISISAGRHFDYESRSRASDLPAQSGACFSFQPVRSHQARPMRGSKLDFTSSRTGPLASRLATNLQGGGPSPEDLPDC